MQFQEAGPFVTGTFLPGQTIVTVTATDACGLTASDTFIVNIATGKDIRYQSHFQIQTLERY